MQEPGVQIPKPPIHQLAGRRHGGGVAGRRGRRRGAAVPGGGAGAGGGGGVPPALAVDEGAQRAGQATGGVSGGRMGGWGGGGAGNEMGKLAGRWFCEGTWLRGTCEGASCWQVSRDARKTTVVMVCRRHAGVNAQVNLRCL